MMKNKLHIINITVGLLCLLVISCQQDEIMQPTLKKHTATSNSSIASRSVTCEVTSEAGSLMDKLDEIANSGGYAKEEITELTINGTVNYEDLRALRPFAKMTKLDMSNMTIVDENGYMNTFFPDNTLDSLASHAHVYMPNSIELIGNNAFQSSNIIAINIPDNVYSIFPYAFADCKKLQTVLLSNNIEQIYYGAFEGCNSLTTINVPSKLKQIQGAAFNGCAFSSFIIPETVETIEWNAFSNNPNLEHVGNWPTKVTEIPGSCFINCPKLKFEIPNHVSKIGDSAFRGCNAITDIIIPSSVEVIEGLAFESCANLKSITIPATLTNVGEYAFAYCRNLELINGTPNWTKISNGLFSECHNLNFDIPVQVDTIGDFALSGCYKLKSELPPNIKYLGNHALFDCKLLTQCITSASLVFIGDYALARCEQMKEITLQEGLETIGYCAFGNTSIKELRIPSTVKTIGNEIVANCEDLRVINWETTADMPELFYSWENYGTLIYAKSGINVHPNNKNLILGDDESGYVTERFELVDGKDFYCPKAFTAKQVVFRKHFNAWTEPNKPGGWRTIALPFTVTKFVAQATGDQPERTLKPFGTEDMGDAKPFWLRTLHNDGFSRETILEAGKPYIICFPNSDQYLPEYNIRGTVEFWGENVTVVDNSQMIPLEGPNYTFYPTFEKIKKSMDIYNIDYNSYYDRMYNIHYAGGSLFRSSIRDTEPYEGYIMNNVTGRAMIAINNQTNGRSIKSFGAVPMEDDM